MHAKQNKSLKGLNCNSDVELHHVTILRFGLSVDFTYSPQRCYPLALASVPFPPWERQRDTSGSFDLTSLFWRGL